jgi:hypothetical protein
MIQVLARFYSVTLLLLTLFQFQPCDAFVRFQMPPSPGRTSFSTTTGGGVIATHSKRPFYAKSSQLPTPEESASALTDYMAKAHGEKLRAIADVEQKYKEEVVELKLKLKEFETEKESSMGAIKTSANSYEFPSTNKDLTSKVKLYQLFISDYIVKAQIERVKAVATAEQKLTEKYEAMILAIKERRSVLD